MPSIISPTHRLVGCIANDDANGDSDTDDRDFGKVVADAEVVSHGLAQSMPAYDAQASRSFLQQQRSQGIRNMMT